MCRVIATLKIIEIRKGKGIKRIISQIQVSV